MTYDRKLGRQHNAFHNVELRHKMHPDLIEFDFRMTPSQSNTIEEYELNFETMSLYIGDTTRK